MQRKVIRSPYVDRDGDGTTIYRVPLAGTKLEAKILPEDWHRLIEGGASPNWYFNGGGVGFGRKLNGKVRIERPARLILGITDPKVFARFRDRNPLQPAPGQPLCLPRQDTRRAGRQYPPQKLLQDEGLNTFRRPKVIRSDTSPRSSPDQIGQVNGADQSPAPTINRHPCSQP